MARSTPPDRRRLFLAAAPGFGKSWLVRAWLAGQRVTWAGPGFAPGEVEDWLVVDDLPALDAAAARALVARLDRLPAGTRAIVVTRAPWPGRLPAGSAALDAHDLALPASDVVQVLSEEYALDGDRLGNPVHELTAGWPSLVHLAGRYLRGGGDLGSLCAAGTALDAFVTEHVLGQLPVPARRLLRRLTALGTACEALVSPRDHRTLGLLVRAGAVVPAPAPPGTWGMVPAPHWLRPVPALAAVVRRREPVFGAAYRTLHAAAAGWYAGQGAWGQAVRSRLRAADLPGTADLLRAHGSAIVAAGGAEQVVEGCEALGDVPLAHGEALAVGGRLTEALAVLEPLAAGQSTVEAGLARRLGQVYYARAEHRAAFEILGRGRIGRADTVEEALLLACTATVHWSVGDGDACRRYADRALLAATAAGDGRALAAAHVALALHAALGGDRAGNAGQYAKALAHAEAVRDAVQTARIRANLVSQLLEEARYPEALAESAQAVAAAEAAGNAGALSLALVNRAEALARLGRLDEAERCGERALEINQRAGTGKVAYALIVLGDVRARRGQRSLARAAYEEAVRAADTDGVRQCFVPALAGLARLVAGDDPDAARAHAEQAVALASGPLAIRALLAVGWVAVAAGDRGTATGAADRAEHAARLHRDRAGLAEALELRAAAGDRPATRRAALVEAAATWRSTGARLDADRVAYQLGQLPGAGAEERLAALVARGTLEAAGVGVAAGAPHVTVLVLGRFEVILDGVPVPASVWRSRKARDLLRILVARRGRRVAREELAALLWPDDDDEQRVAHRLSVALSTLRSVLDPDRRLPADHYVAAAPNALAADPAHLDIDLDTFLSEAEVGQRLHEQRRYAEAREVLASAERRYAGDVFEDEPYDDWAVPVREEARATYLRVTRLLARGAAGRGATDEAVGYLLRILARDPYDESCHRDVTDLLELAGRHGEARRARARYAAAMREIGRPAV